MDTTNEAQGAYAFVEAIVVVGYPFYEMVAMLITRTRHH